MIIYVVYDPVVLKSANYYGTKEEAVAAAIVLNRSWQKANCDDTIKSSVYWFNVKTTKANMLAILNQQYDTINGRKKKVPYSDMASIVKAVERISNVHMV